MNKSISLLQKVNELLNSSYSYKKKKNTSDDHTYTFKADTGHHYNVGINHDGDTAHVAFSQGNTIAKTGSQGNMSHKVFGTVKNIVKDHLDQHPEITKLAFSSSKAEGSRSRLYSTMAKSMTHHHVEHDFGDDTYFLIHKKDIK